MSRVFPHDGCNRYAPLFRSWSDAGIDQEVVAQQPADEAVYEDMQKLRLTQHNIDLQQSRIGGHQQDAGHTPGRQGQPQPQEGVPEEGRV